MNHAYKLSKSQIRGILSATFPDYNGRKFSIEFTPKLTLYDTNWAGGTHNDYAFVRADGRQAMLDAPAPWVNPYEGQTFDIPADVIIVQHSYFCGADCGITLYANPVNMPKWITAPITE